ncbi:DUF2306 domain-containing protein [Bernardetia sp. ABR2-2B]|uniref:DUF2306 domain-containing protein n=1 Tax=Bernardetia sp. ABR2-2B TaxID=3127472 RepID=UPI0030D2787B
MENFVRYTLSFHVLVGTIALITGAVAILSKKGKKWHNQSGKIYFWAMTLVFITGVIVAGFRFNRFLFLIAFLSYYSVFSGVRALKLKKLHKDQNPKWYDWAAGVTNGTANIIFIGLGLYYLFRENNNLAGALLSIGFGIGGFMISYTNLKSFIIRPTKPFHWYTAHIGNMMGGYIATFTAFSATVVSRFDLMNPFVAFALPPLIGVPILIYFTSQVEKKFTTSAK